MKQSEKTELALGDENSMPEVAPGQYAIHSDDYEYIYYDRHQDWREKHKHEYTVIFKFIDGEPVVLWRRK
jgi:hypothetical protein